MHTYMHTVDLSNIHTYRDGSHMRQCVWAFVRACVHTYVCVCQRDCILTHTIVYVCSMCVSTIHGERGPPNRKGGVKDSCKPNVIYLLDACDAASMEKQHVPLASDQLCNLLAEVSTEPVQHDDDTLLGTRRRFQSPIQECQDVLCPVRPTLLELEQQPRRNFDVVADTFSHRGDMHVYVCDRSCDN